MTTPEVPLTAAQRGEIPKSKITAILTQSGDWIPVAEGSFDTCEINFYDDLTGNRVGGVLGFRFVSKGVEGRTALIFASMQTVTAVQMEEPEGDTDGK